MEFQEANAVCSVSIIQETTTYDVRVLLELGQSESSKGLNYIDEALRHITPFYLPSKFWLCVCLLS